ncbi:hypothetical protein ACR34G_03370 [Mycoplasma sp. 480]|uniref:hypothetical protein n=1 Tax=Mycoplasma sp. 480 TaxID=3440155 RepID=UPI003F51394C
MKKKILLTSAAILTFASVNLVASCNEEKSKEQDFPKSPIRQKHDELFDKYKEKYVGTDNYVFDDFKEFDFNNINYYQIVNAKKLVKLNPVYELTHLETENNQNIYLYFTEESQEKFAQWMIDFNFKYSVYKEVIDKFEPKKKIKQKNNKEDIYLVKESIFDFSISKKHEEYSEIIAMHYYVMDKIIQIPNVKIKGLFALTTSFAFGPSEEHSYFSNLDIESNYSFDEREKGDHSKIFSIPKPKIEKLIPNIPKKEIDKFNSSKPIINLKTTLDFGLKSENDLNDWYNIENDWRAREDAQIIANQDSENFYDYDLTFSRERKVRDYDVKTDERREYVEKDSIHFILSRPLQIISTEGKNKKREY